MFVGTWHPFCLENSGIQCSFVVIVRISDLSNAERLTQAVKTLWKHSLKVRHQFIPKSVQAATKQSRHMSRVLVLRLLRVIGSVGLGPRVVRGAMLSVAGSYCGRIAHPRPSSIWPEHSMLQATWREQAPSTKNFEIGHVCAFLPMALETPCQMFLSFLELCLLVVLVQFRRTPSRSSAPCQTLTTQTMRSWKAVAKADGEHSKRTHLGATCFERVYVIFCV